MTPFFVYCADSIVLGGSVRSYLVMPLWNLAQETRLLFGSGPMSKNLNRAGRSQRIAVLCACGKKLTSPVQYAGKRLKCPHCSQPVLVPDVTSSQHELQVKDELEGFSKTTLIKLWSFVGVVALAGIFFSIWPSHSWHMAGDLSEDGKVIEQNLTDALGNEDATEKSNGESVSSLVQQRNAKVAEENRISVDFEDLPIKSKTENIFYVSQRSHSQSPRGTVFSRALTSNAVFGHRLNIKFDGEYAQGENYYDINGKPTKSTISVDNENIISLEKGIIFKGYLRFANPGKATVTIELGNYSKTIRFHVVEIPIPPNPSRDEVIKALGFPDKKKEGAILSPERGSVDGIFYDTQTYEVLSGTIVYQHWSYNKFPGLVLAWGAGEFRVLTRSPWRKKGAELFD